MAGILTYMAEPGGGNITKSALVTTHMSVGAQQLTYCYQGVAGEIMQLGAGSLRRR